MGLKDSDHKAISLHYVEYGSDYVIVDDVVYLLSTPERRAALELFKALKKIIDASESRAASGGEMWWTEAVYPTVEEARVIVDKIEGET